MEIKTAIKEAFLFSCTTFNRKLFRTAQDVHSVYLCTPSLHIFRTTNILKKFLRPKMSDDPPFMSHVYISLEIVVQKMTNIQERR